MKPTIPIARSLLTVLVVFAYTSLLDYADWGRGPLRAAALLAGGLVIYLNSRRRSAAGPTRAAAFTLTILLAALTVLRLVQLVDALGGSGPTSDIAATTMASVDLVVSGENPYTSVIDPVGESVGQGGSGTRFFGGFKYGPITTLTFAPGVLIGGTDGYLITSFLLLLMTAAGAGLWASQSGRTAGVGVAALVMVPSFLRHELFSSGVNDLAPVALGTAAFAFRARGGTILPAILLGMSFGAKPLPAALYAIPLLLMGGKYLVFTTTAALTALTVYLPALLASPRELLAGLVIYNVVRPPDSTGIVTNLPEGVRRLIGVASTAFALAIVFLLRPLQDLNSPARWAGVTVLSIAVFLAGGSHIHRNYLLWLVPVMSVAVAASVWGRQPGEVGPPS